MKDMLQLLALDALLLELETGQKLTSDIQETVITVEGRTVTEKN